MKDKVLSYILVKREGDQVFYWKYGQRGGWTGDLTETRRYGRKASANYARFKLLKREGMTPTMFRVEAIEE